MVFVCFDSNSNIASFKVSSLVLAFVMLFGFSVQGLACAFVFAGNVCF